jgi:hypothetical protein
MCKLARFTYSYASRRPALLANRDFDERTTGGTDRVLVTVEECSGVAARGPASPGATTLRHSRYLLI